MRFSDPNGKNCVLKQSARTVALTVLADCFVGLFFQNSILQSPSSLSAVFVICPGTNIPGIPSDRRPERWGQEHPSQQQELYAGEERAIRMQQMAVSSRATPRSRSFMFGLFSPGRPGCQSPAGTCPAGGRGGGGDVRISAGGRRCTTGRPPPGRRRQSPAYSP